MKTLLVTGASGVLAKNFINKHSQTYKIIEAKREPKTRNEIKIDSWTMDEPNNEVNAVIHFAGKYLIDESLQSKKNVHDSVIGTAAAVADYCAKTKTPLIALGSYFEKAPLDMQPWSYYSSAKIAAHNMLTMSALNSDFAFKYVYCYDTFGPDTSRRKIVDVLLDPETSLLELSEGLQRMNLTHVDDLVDGISLLVQNLLEVPSGVEEFQIKSQLNEFTLKEITEMVNSIRSRKIDIRYGAKPYRNREVFSVWESARSIPNFEERYKFEDFIVEYIGNHNV